MRGRGWHDRRHAARADLLDIAAYIARDNPERAATFIDALEERCAGLLDFTEKGRSRPELGGNLRSIPHRRYVIFYTPGGEAVRIERILHGSRDANAELRGPD